MTDGFVGFFLDENALSTITEKLRGRSLVIIMLGLMALLCIITAGNALTLVSQPDLSSSVPYLIRSAVFAGGALFLCAQAAVLHWTRRSTSHSQLSGSAQWSPSQYICIVR